MWKFDDGRTWNCTSLILYIQFKTPPYTNPIKDPARIELYNMSETE